VDTWPLSKRGRGQAKCMGDRLQAARDFLDQHRELREVVGQFTFVDSWSNDMGVELGCWPERYVVVEHGVAQWASDLGVEYRYDAVCRDVLGVL